MEREVECSAEVALRPKASTLVAGGQASLRARPPVLTDDSPDPEGVVVGGEPSGARCGGCEQPFRLQSFG